MDVVAAYSCHTYIVSRRKISNSKTSTNMVASKGDLVKKGILKLWNTCMSICIHTHTYAHLVLKMPTPGIYFNVSGLVVVIWNSEHVDCVNSSVSSTFIVSSSSINQ